MMSIGHMLETLLLGADGTLTVQVAPVRAADL
jgi:hypothetical protein